STSGGKKSVVDTKATSSLIRHTAASSNGARPTSRDGSARSASCRTSADNGAAPHLAAQPPQEVHSVSLRSAVEAGGPLLPVVSVVPIVSATLTPLGLRRMGKVIAVQQQ